MKTCSSLAVYVTLKCAMNSRFYSAHAIKNSMKLKILSNIDIH